MASLSNFAARLHFVELSSGDERTCLWPCVKYDNTEQFRSEVKELQKIIGHGRDEECEMSLEWIKFRAESASRSNEACDQSGEAKPPPIPVDQAALVYLLGKVVENSGEPEQGEAGAEKTGRRRRLLFEPDFTLHSFNENFSKAMETRRVEGFVDAVAEASRIHGLTTSSSAASSTAAPTSSYSQQIGPENAAKANGVAAAKTAPTSKPLAEFSEARVIFVPVPVQGQDDLVPWPAIEFENWGKFCRQLKNRHLLKTETEELELDRINRSLGEQEYAFPYAYLFGDPPSSERIIPLGNRRALDTQRWDKACPYAKVQGYWEAYTQLQFALNELPSPFLKPIRSSSCQKVASKTATGMGKPSKATSQPKPKKRPPPDTVFANITNKKKGENTSKPKQKKTKKNNNPPPETQPTEQRPPPPSFDRKNVEYIPSFEEVKPILEAEGYSFQDGKYYMPGAEPENVGNQQYFESESAFRKHLCSVGIQVTKVRGRDVDSKYAPLVAWVSYHRLVRLVEETEATNGQRLRVDSIPKNNVAIDMFNQVGIVWEHKRWRIPQSHKSFDELEFRNEISRHGLPAECNVASLSKEEVQCLELYIGDPDFRNGTFFLSKT